MGKIQDSLKANLEEIKEALPEEFHGDLMAEIEAAEDPVEMTEGEVKKAVETELIANNDVPKQTRELICEAGIEAPAAACLPSEEEQKQNMEEMLAATTAEAEKSAGE